MQLHLHPVGYATKVGSGQFKIDNRCVIVIIFYNKIIKTDIVPVYPNSVRYTVSYVGVSHFHYSSLIPNHPSVTGRDAFPAILISAFMIPDSSLNAVLAKGCIQTSGKVLILTSTSITSPFPVGIKPVTSRYLYPLFTKEASTLNPLSTSIPHSIYS